jgi:hypothetical protein
LFSTHDAIEVCRPPVCGTVACYRRLARRTRAYREGVMSSRDSSRPASAQRFDRARDCSLSLTGDKISRARQPGKFRGFGLLRYRVSMLSRTARAVQRILCLRSSGLPDCLDDRRKKFPVTATNFPVRHRKFPVPLSREFQPKTRRKLGISAGSFIRRSLKLGNFPVSSLHDCEAEAHS